MRIFISGAGGALGHEIIKQLIASGNQEFIAISSSPSKISSEFPGITVLSNDDFLNNDPIFQDEDIFINCAFPRNTKGVVFSDGLRFVKTILQKARAKGCRKIINISSQSIYGEKRNYMASEQSSIILESTYAVGKFAQEMLVETLYSDVCYTNIRLASLISPGLPQRVVNQMISKAFEQKVLTVLDNHRLFGFLDAEDAARAIIRLALVPSEKWAHEYNLGSKDSYSLLQIAEQVKSVADPAFGTDIQLVVNKDDSDLCSAIDSQKLIDLVGEYQQCTLRDTIIKIVKSVMQ